MSRLVLVSRTAEGDSAWQVEADGGKRRHDREYRNRDEQLDEREPAAPPVRASSLHHSSSPSVNCGGSTEGMG